MLAHATFFVVPTKDLEGGTALLLPPYYLGSNYLEFAQFNGTFLGHPPGFAPATEAVSY